MLARLDLDARSKSKIDKKIKIFILYKLCIFSLIERLPAFLLYWNTMERIKIFLLKMYFSNIT
jgi:hypothetical protein